ncbi:succinate dehydrogenase cytochrome B subunit, b558 family [Mitsuokella sp. oral taxon 131]|uniref:succinate dehydrogenase cytochrome B subunit, b558 family n=1 Tax=Mitsuokella sp. oral taxon 131 TaxID=1321780 RepID=UPI0003AE578D|nr:succinate dehydrogenase cytochrome B subunit, b558 family [Mitsuokella sp. oral taxon 131]ERL05417.1 succinate dehydrogenase cytochrome B subunit, b558 family [Mitsuokella sp. oral taxon 131 str. W9106]
MFHTTFYLRRLHSLVGLLALGLVLFEHIFTNSMAIGGPKALNGALAMMELIPHPIFVAIEVTCIGVPLLFHAIYGIYIALQAKNNPSHYGYVRNWQFALQRWTAWYLVVFLLWHVFYLRIFVKGITGTPISYELLQTYFTSHPVFTVLYILGMFAAIFHFTNGITTFCMTWGIAKGPRVQSVINVLSMCLCAVLCLVTLVFMGSYFI